MQLVNQLIFIFQDKEKYTTTCTRCDKQDAKLGPTCICD